MSKKTTEPITISNISASEENISTFFLRRVSSTNSSDSEGLPREKTSSSISSGTTYSTATDIFSDENSISSVDSGGGTPNSTLLSGKVVSSLGARNHSAFSVWDRFEAEEPVINLAHLPSPHLFLTEEELPFPPTGHLERQVGVSSTPPVEEASEEVGIIGIT